MFSVTIPTRDRPALFKEALGSVLAQSFNDYEIIVIDDGSKPEFRAELEVIKASSGDNTHWIYLDRRDKGHGHPFARNTAASFSNAEYICTLDDDDIWTDVDYLKNLNEIIRSKGAAVDAVFSNQIAYRNNELVPGPLWLDRLKSYLESCGRIPDRASAYTVRIEDVFASSSGFCHLNNLVLRKGFYESIGGLDETLRYEPDRDVFLRVIDKAKTMLYLSDYVARHNVPDQKKTDNVSTKVTILQKRLIQLKILGKGVLFSQNPMVREHCSLRKSYVLKAISDEMLLLGRRRDAVRYAIEAYGAKPSLKWGAYTLYLAVVNIFRKSQDN